MPSFLRFGISIVFTVSAIWPNVSTPTLPNASESVMPNRIKTISLTDDDKSHLNKVPTQSTLEIRVYAKNVSPMYHYNQGKKQNDQHGYESQNCHGLRLLRKYIFSFCHNKTLSMFPSCFSHAARKAITASFPEYHSAYSYPAVSRYVHSCLYFWPTVHLLQKHWQSWQQ